MLTGNGLRLHGPPFGMEEIQEHDVGGYHPIHLGDLLNEDSYRAIHKLGHGGFATVWLCRDLRQKHPIYTAIKVIMADLSDTCRELQSLETVRAKVGQGVNAEHICLPLEHFFIEGPNGRHLCLVLPVLGPRVSCFIKPAGDFDGNLRSIAHQAAQSMAELHACGLCHGDFRPSNILLRTQGIDGLSEEQVLEALGQPQTFKVTNMAGETLTDGVGPEYMVRPVEFDKVEAKFITDQACMIDLGESFQELAPPEELGTPVIYRAPELLLNNSAGIGSDIWALACTISEIRTGRRLFDAMDDDENEILRSIVLLLGKLPAPWRTSWEARQRCFENETDDKGNVVERERKTEPEKSGAHSSSIHPAVANGARFSRDMLALGFWYRDSQPGQEMHRDIAGSEAEVLADLLGKLLKYTPGELITADEAQNHPWFSN